MPIAATMALLHSLGRDDWTEVQHDCSGHVTPLPWVSVSCDADDMMNGTITFFRSRYSKWGATWHFGHVMPLALALVSHYANVVINATITFLRSRQSNWDASWHFWPPDALAPALHDAMASSVAPLYSLGQDDQNKVQHDFLSHVTPLQPAMTSHDANVVINGIITFPRSIQSNWKKHDCFWVMCFHWYWHHMTPMALSVAHGNDASTDTHTGTKGHIIPLNIHLNITWCLYVSIYTSYEPNAINNVDRNCGTHIFYIISICPWTNMHATLYMCSTALLL